MKTSRILLASIHLFAAFAVIAHADDGFIFSTTGDGLRWRAPVTWPSVHLRITGDKIAPFEQTVGSSSQFSVPLSGPGGPALPDGVYKWEVVGQPVMSPALAQSLSAARKAGNDAAAASILAAANLPQGVRTSGAFSVLNGKLVPADAEEPAAQQAAAPAGNLAQSGPLIPLSGVVAPDSVTNDDLIVIGSLAVGQDAINGENFGFDTFRLKENNLRIHFDDTSNTASFPANDWRIVINDTTNGGGSFFAIEDSTANRTPFKIEAGAKTNALVVDDASRVGIGTGTPVVNLHIVTGNTPTARLDQDGSSGFTPQVWDMAGNETNFFIRDVTNGSRLPFRIRPNAPTSSIDIAGSGNVGLGTSAPATRLHLQSTNTDIALRIQQTAGTVPSSWDFTNNSATGRLNITDDTTSMRIPFKMGPGAPNNLFRIGIPAVNTVEVNGTLTVNGTFNNLSSREFKNIVPGVDSASVLEKIASLPLFTWSYKDSNGERHFGPVAEDFYAHFQLGTDEKHISPNDMAGVALGAIKGLHEQLRERDAQIKTLRQKSDTLEQQMKALTEAVEALKVGSPTKASP